ncbi:MAG: hypothetical protein MSA49_05940 [Clostridia bacterium]|nr:hypothetical protein [Clostridia bacterium]
MNTTIATAVLPFLLGGGPVAYRTALRLFFRHGLFSVVFARKKTLFSHPRWISRFFPLPDGSADDFIFMTLERYIAEEERDRIFVLVPCTPESEAFVKRNRSRLESRFVLKTPNNVCALHWGKGRENISPREEWK